MTEILQQCQLGIFRGVGAGLFNLFAAFKYVGEPAPTGLLRMVQDLSFEGPYPGGQHQYMIKGELKLTIPNPDRGDISQALLARMLRQGNITRDDWEEL